MGLCLGLKHPQHSLQMYLQRGLPFKRSIFCFLKKNSAFLVLQISETQIQRQRRVIERVRSGNSLICVVRFGKPFQHYNRRGLTVQDFLFGERIG